MEGNREIVSVNGNDVAIGISLFKRVTQVNIQGKFIQDSEIWEVTLNYTQVVRAETNFLKLTIKSNTL